jgi:hypothetical protein
MSGSPHYVAQVDPDLAEQNYASAEEAFLAGVRKGLDAPSLGTLASDVAEAASAWNASAYERLHDDSEAVALDRLTERTEVLTGLWTDIARAFRGLPTLRDG